MNIDAPIKKNNYELPRTTDDAVKAEKKKQIYTPVILNKIRESVRVRTEQANELFKTELFGVAQSIAENADSLYHSSKYVILERFPTCNYGSATDSKTNDSAIMIDFSFYEKSCYQRKCKIS